MTFKRKKKPDFDINISIAVNIMTKQNDEKLDEHLR